LQVSVLGDGHSIHKFWHLKSEKICCKLCQSCYACIRSMSLVTDVTQRSDKDQSLHGSYVFNPSYVSHGFFHLTVIELRHTCF